MHSNYVVKEGLHETEQFIKRTKAIIGLDKLAKEAESYRSIPNVESYCAYTMKELENLRHDDKLIKTEDIYEKHVIFSIGHNIINRIF